MSRRRACLPGRDSLPRQRIVGTGHHWYWTGQSHITMALAAMFRRSRLCPDAAHSRCLDFVKLSRGKCDVCNKVIAVPHKWTFYFLWLSASGILSAPEFSAF